MKWLMMIVGAALAVVPFYWTMTLNGLTLIGVIVMLWGAGLMIRDDVNDGL